MENKDVTVLHTFRIGNKFAYYLTNMVVNFACTNSIHFNHNNELPAQAKAILQLDKQGTPNIRIKKCKNTETMSILKV